MLGTLDKRTINWTQSEKAENGKGLKYRISRGGRVVPVELDKVVEGDEETHQVHQDPEEVQDVVPIGALK